jgi:hypothetical protein
MFFDIGTKWRLNRCWFPDTGYWMLDAGCTLLVARCWLHVAGCKGTARGYARPTKIRPNQSKSDPPTPSFGAASQIRPKMSREEAKGAKDRWVPKLRNEPNFSSKKPMKVHKCQKNEPKTNPILSHRRGRSCHPERVLTTKGPSGRAPTRCWAVRAGQQPAAGNRTESDPPSLKLWRGKPNQTKSR